MLALARLRAPAAKRASVYATPLCASPACGSPACARTRAKYAPVCRDADTRASGVYVFICYTRKRARRSLDAERCHQCNSNRRETKNIYIMIVCKNIYYEDVLHCQSPRGFLHALVSRFFDLNITQFCAGDTASVCAGRLPLNLNPSARQRTEYVINFVFQSRTNALFVRLYCANFAQ